MSFDRILIFRMQKYHHVNRTNILKFDDIIMNINNTSEINKMCKFIRIIIKCIISPGKPLYQSTLHLYLHFILCVLIYLYMFMGTYHCNLVYDHKQLKKIYKGIYALPPHSESNVTSTFPATL